MVFNKEFSVLTGKPGKSFSSREKSEDFKNLPESQGILGESGKSQGKLNQKILKDISYHKASTKTVVT